MTLPIYPGDPDVEEPRAAPPFLVEVAFKGNRRAFYRCDLDTPPPLSAAVIVEVDRGEDLARVHAVGARALQRSAGVPHGVGDTMPAERVVRLATPAEVARERALRVDDEQARRTAMEKVRAAKLDLKLSDAEWQFDRKKLTFYFTAEKRIDFRSLVRDLAALFRARIELKQYGVRDEAKRLSGIGRCGREYCSAAWLPELRPVNLGVAKEQKLSLNPSQISGACGRLMCCLRYEHDFYVAARKRFPKEGRILVLDRGEEKVVALDIFRDRVTLRNPEGEQRIVELAEVLAAAPVAPDTLPRPLTVEDDDQAEGTGLPGEPGAATRPDVEEPTRQGARPETRAGARPVRPPREPRAARVPRPPRTELAAPAVDQPPSAPSAAATTSSARPSESATGEQIDDASERIAPDDALTARDDAGLAGADSGTSTVSRTDGAEPDDDADSTDAPRRRRRGRRGGRRGRTGLPGPAAPGGEADGAGPSSA